MGRLEPQSMEFLDRAPHRLALSCLSPAPASAVFDVLKDFEHSREWLGSVVSKVEVTSPPYGVGTNRTVFFYRGLARFDEVFIGWEEPHLWCFTTVGLRPQVFRKHVEQVRLEPRDEGGCRISYRFGVEFSPVFRPLAPAVLAWVRSKIGPVLRRLSDQAAQCVE